jgi:membrane-associated phospholipid phosphatase
MNAAVSHADFAVNLTRPSSVIPLGAILSLMVCSLLVVALMMDWAGLGIDFLRPSNAKYLLALLLLSGICFRLREAAGNRSRIVRDFCEYLGLFVFVSLLGATASYPLAVATNGFVDADLARLDELLRFDWSSLYRLVSASPVLQQIGSLAYANIYLSPILIFGGLAITGDRARAQLFLISFWLAAVITLTLFLFFPAVGPLAYLWKDPVTYMPTSALYQAELLPLLQGRVISQVDLGALQGLVCAPSFHTASAVIFIVIAWQSKYLRWPVVLLNGAMLLSTPVEGTHYLIDMIAGGVVGILALCAVAAIQHLILKSREDHWVGVLKSWQFSFLAAQRQALRSLRD